MKLLPLLCLCLLTLSGSTFAEDPNVIKVAVKEGDDAILPCSLNTKENIVQKLFDWKKDGQKEVFLYDAGYHYNNGREGQDEQFKGRVSHFPEQLEFGNTSIIIRSTKVTDSGDYTCDFPRLQPRQILHINLVVGAAPEPSIMILDETDDGVQLRCMVQGAFPEPKLEWQDSTGNIVPAKEPQITERGGSYSVILQTTVTKTDHYRCVATQEEINHQFQQSPLDGLLLFQFWLLFFSLVVLFFLCWQRKITSVVRKIQQLTFSPGNNLTMMLNKLYICCKVSW